MARGGEFEFTTSSFLPQLFVVLVYELPIRVELEGVPFVVLERHGDLHRRAWRLDFEIPVDRDLAGWRHPAPRLARILHDGVAGGRCVGCVGGFGLTTPFK